jgi:hypothetical protein
MSRQRLINDTIPSSHLDLLKKVVKRVGVDRASVTKFERFGLSGAELYRLTPPNAVPYVVKVDETRKIDREYAAAYSVSPQFDELHVEKPVGPTSEGYKALVYRLVATKPGADGVIELKNKYEKALSADGTVREELLAEVVTAIQRTYQKFMFAHTFTGNKAKETFRDQYAGYVRLRKRSTDRLTQLFESHESPLYAYGIEFTNPRPIIERILDAPLRPLRVGATHGDLHPSNVVFSSTDDPRLVDFANAGRDQHLFKDFITMESSLRFMMFPRHIHPALLGPVDVALNNDWSCKDAQKIVDGVVPSDGARALGVMIACVREVRSACDGTLTRGGIALKDPEKEEEYFRSLALLLLGQQQFDTFPLIRVAVNLHLLGTRYA